jgi:hypothetical protein
MCTTVSGDLRSAIIRRSQGRQEEGTGRSEAFVRSQEEDVAEILQMRHTPPRRCLTSAWR